MVNMSASKLTESQRKVLQALGDGAHKWVDHIGGRRPVKALEEMGLVWTYSSQRRGRINLTYAKRAVITDAGRIVLRSQS